MDKIKDKTILITGGSGFIGSHLTERLIENNKVIHFDNGHRNAIRYTTLENHKNLTLIQGDVLEARAVRKAMAGADIVVHMAAIAGIDSVVKKPITTMQVNLQGTQNVFEAAVACNVQRVINFSTSEVYGPHIYKGDEATMTTQGPVGQMRWVYSTAKLAGEHYAYCYMEEHGLPVVSIRPFNVYGPRQIGEGAIQRFIAASIAGRDITIYGDGTQIRSWCYVDDFVEGVLLTIFKPEAIGEVFNIGNPRQTVTVLKLAETVQQQARSKAVIRFKESQGPDVQVRVPSIKKAREKLGFEPRVALEDGIKQTIKWYRETFDGQHEKN